jgi:transposase
MRIQYTLLIKESLEVLSDLEAKQTQAILLRRFQLLRLLKSGQAKSMEQAASLIGLSTVQARRIWKQYTQWGIQVTDVALKPGRRSRLDSKEESELSERVTKGTLRSLKQVQKYLIVKHKLSYTESGVWYLLKSLNLKFIPKKAKGIFGMRKAIEV